MTDTVFNPKHYMQGSHECIDEIQAMLSPEEFKGFLKGNIIKYRYRANLKNGKEDLAKADNYVYYLMHGCFKKVKDNDSVSDNSNNDPMPDVFGYIINNSNNLSSGLEKLDQVFKHYRFSDTYKGEKITNDKDLMSFNLFDALKQVVPIAELVAQMYRQKDIDKNTVATLSYISRYLNSSSAKTIDKDDPNFDKFLIVFKDKSNLHLKVPRGYDLLDVFKPDNICAWQNVYVDKE